MMSVGLMPRASGLPSKKTEARPRNNVAEQLVVAWLRWARPCPTADESLSRTVSVVTSVIVKVNATGKTWPFAPALDRSVTAFAARHRDCDRADPVAGERDQDLARWRRARRRRPAWEHGQGCHHWCGGGRAAFVHLDLLSQVRRLLRSSRPPPTTLNPRAARPWPSTGTVPSAFLAGSTRTSSAHPLD
jgi:hypothetical protein